MLLHNLGRLSRARLLSGGAGALWHVAVVGSGPAGFYTADQLLKGDPDVHVDIYERLPVPFGLVRYGVAPDHQDVKNVTERFCQIAGHERCSLLANVRVGADDPEGAAHAASRPATIGLDSLSSHYHAVVLAYGADADRPLGLPGEELGGVYSAREFVEWYNGHPSAAGRSFGLGACETAVVVGNGNVALDCARVLCATPEQLVGGTDIAAQAAAELAGSAVRRVVVLGRRGVLQAAFTIKELRELSKLNGSTTRLLAPADAFGAAVIEAAAAERPRKRVVDLMAKLANGDDGLPPPPPRAPARREIRIEMQRSPVGFIGGPSIDDGGPRVSAVRLKCMGLEGLPGSSQRAKPIEGTEYEVPCGLALRAVGYRSTPIEGAPFDAARGVVPNAGGRVDGRSGLYVVGWLKRGPSGVILANVTDAAETAAALLADRAGGGLGFGGDGGPAVRVELAQQGAPVLGFGEWRRIDAEELRRGAASGKVREKLVAVDEMIEVAAAPGHRA